VNRRKPENVYVKLNGLLQWCTHDWDMIQWLELQRIRHSFCPFWVLSISTTIKKKQNEKLVLKVYMAVRKLVSSVSKNTADKIEKSEVPNVARASIYSSLWRICKEYFLHVLEVSCLNFGLDSNDDFVTRRFLVMNQVWTTCNTYLLYRHVRSVTFCSGQKYVTAHTMDKHEETLQFKRR